MRSNVIYFGGGGKYQKEYEQLFNELVPIWGNADTVCGEVLRCASNIYYENYNNGNSNTVLDGEVVASFENDLARLSDYFSMRHNQVAVDIVKKIYHIYLYEYGYNEYNDEVFEALIDNVVVELLYELEN